MRKDFTVRKAKLPHPVIGLLQMVVGIFTPMEEGDRDFAKHELIRMQLKTKSLDGRTRKQEQEH